MSHPLLTKWLADCLPVTSEFYTRAELARDTIADSDPDIADRLERALDKCQYRWEDDEGNEKVCDCSALLHEPRQWRAWHTYQPLVTA
jgi:hypothetical protein